MGHLHFWFLKFLLGEDLLHIGLNCLVTDQPWNGSVLLFSLVNWTILLRQNNGHMHPLPLAWKEISYITPLAQIEPKIKCRTHCMYRTPMITKPEVHCITGNEVDIHAPIAKKNLFISCCLQDNLMFSHKFHCDILLDFF